MPTIAHCYQCSRWEARNHDKTVGRCEEHEGQLAEHENPPSDHAMVLLPAMAPACGAAEWDERELAEALDEIADCEAVEADRRRMSGPALSPAEAKPRRAA
jgi:hypothetical protein